MSLTLGIDLGTSACRVALLDEQGHCQALARASLPAPLTSPTGIEQNPLVWWQACEKALREVFINVPASEVAAIAIDGTSSTLLLSTRQGQPLGPALMYNDSRAREQAASLAKIAPLEAAVHSPSSSLAKLLWLLEHAPPDTPFVALHQADWLLGRLGGRYDRSDENNALKLGYDPLQRQWPTWLEQLTLSTGDPISACLPTVVPAGSPLGPVDPAIAREFGLRSDCQLIAGTTDSTASFLAAGAHAIGEAVTTLGSTLVVKVLSDRPVFAPQYGVYSHRLGEQWLIGGASNSGGTVLRHFFSDAEITELSRHIDPAADCPLDYYPLLTRGERFPVNDPDMAGCLEPRPDDDAAFLHGLFDGIAAIEARGYRRLHELGAPWPVSVRTVGGGAGNAVWEKIRARHLSVTMLKADFAEAACGSARLARAGLEKIR
ncbi:FGGY-family carbohydrate kinase [Sulfuriflexus sp.]|uniref:FGGY-family carbohydrate kinase n=1 Tax=Sulfuriflexus sp. TaxID=2015443 RepID=UPI0028CE03F0|nr:FGGY-family carbohydrate kinase [Sulfuriflexus sp.]MDT8403021.1 FGGY-family carbohydrate kinase [Sulfuriflexus sp.]